MKNYVQPKIIVVLFSEEDVLTTSGLDAADDVGTWGNWFVPIEEENL